MSQLPIFHNSIHIWFQSTGAATSQTRIWSQLHPTQMVLLKDLDYLFDRLIVRDRDLEVTNIAAGYMVNSPSQGIVSIQITSKIGLESSKFDYANVTNEGLVDNTVTTYDVNSESNSTVWRDYVNSNFPIFGQTILIDNSAVYAGLAQRRITEGLVAAVRPPFPQRSYTHAWNSSVQNQYTNGAC